MFCSKLSHWSCIPVKSPWERPYEQRKAPSHPILFCTFLAILFFVAPPTDRGASGQKPHNKKWPHCLPPLGRLLSDQLLTRSPLARNKAAFSPHWTVQSQSGNIISQLLIVSVWNVVFSAFSEKPKKCPTQHTTHNTICFAHVHPPSSHLLVGLFVLTHLCIQQIKIQVFTEPTLVCMCHNDIIYVTLFN